MKKDGFIALIVEDEPILQSIIRETLSQIAETIFVADTLDQALIIIAEKPILHIVTLDLKLPGSTMEDVIASVPWIRETHPSCAIIILSGNLSKLVFEKLHGSTIDAAVEKQQIRGQATFLKPLMAALYRHCAGDPERTCKLNELMQTLLPSHT